MLSAFLIPRLEVLLKGTGRAIVVSALLFGSYHVYQGPISAITVCMAGVINGAVFAVTRRLWPLVIGHALYDILAYARFL